MQQGHVKKTLASTALRFGTSIFTLVTAASAYAGAFVSDFNSGLPTGSYFINSGSVPGVVSPTNGVGNSGVLKLTTVGGGSQNTFFVTNLSGGSLTNFRVTLRLALGGGNCCGDRQADGMSFSFGNDLPLGGTIGEEGAGTGFIVDLDTWDNGGGGTDTAPAIDVKVGGNGDPNIVLFQSMSSYGNTIRDSGRADAGPVLTNSLGQQVPLFTHGPGTTPGDTNFVNVYFEMFPDKTFSLSYSNVVVWNHVAIPSYNPISGTVAFAIGGRTGGANENAWIDNLSVLANFEDGPAIVTTQPVNQTVTESQTATFNFAVNGTPPYSIQWYSNGVAIAGANGTSYTTPITTTNMNGTLYSASVTNSLGGQLSGNATLTVNAGLIAKGATTDNLQNRVRVTYNKPAALIGNYTISGNTVVSATYGTSHSEVLLTTGSPIAPGAGYTVTITGELGEDGSSMVPSPTVLSFSQIGAFCSDFAGTLPANSTLFGSAYRTNETGTNVTLHLTDDYQNTGVYGQLYFSNLVGNSTFYGLQSTWRMRIGGELNAHADGFSFNWAPDLVASSAFQAAEDGLGSYLSFTIDTWDGGSGPDTGIEIRWRGQRVAFQHIPRTDEGGTNYITKDVFVNAAASIDAAGNVSFTYDTNTITATITNWTGVPGLAMNWAARTGGEADNFWIDDLCVSNFTIGAVAFVKQPVTTTALEGVAATFTAGVDGSPTYYYQWFTNGTAIAGATNASYTTAATTAAMEGLAYSVTVSNLFSSVTSSNAILHVNTAPRLVSVKNVGDTEVHVVWTRPVDLFSGVYSFDNGIFENLRDYGSNAAEVVIYTDSMSSGVTYTLTAQDVAEDGNASNLQFPNPDSRSYRVGYGSVCYDFASGTPPGTTVGAQAVVSGGFLHLNDMNAPGGNGWFFAPDANAGFPVDRLLVTFKTLIGRTDANRPADGMSFNIGSDINAGTQPGEEGYGGQGLTVSFDTWDNNGADTAPAIEIFYKGALVASRPFAGQREGGRAPAGPFLFDINGNALALDTSNTFANVRISVAPDGKLDFYYKDYLIFQNAQLVNYSGFQNANISFGARVGGASENHWVDDLCVNAFSIGGVQFTQSPTNVTVPELRRTKMSVGVNGLPPYSVQWYSNNVAIPGATALVYDTPTLNRNANGAQYYAVVGNQFGAVTSGVAVVTISLDNTIPTVLSAGYDGSKISLLFSEPLDRASAETAGYYTLNSGVTVTSAALTGGSLSNSVVLTLSGALNPANYNRLTINGVRDRSTYNVVNTNVALNTKAPIASNGSTNNMIVWEAEDYDANRTGPQTPASQWVFANTLPGYSGRGYMSAEPSIGAGGGDVPDTYTNSPTLDYVINFPVAGTYYLWARGSTANDGGNNSFHFGIDYASTNELMRRVGNRVQNWGGDAANVDKFGWVNDANGTGAGSVAQFVITTPGTHVFSVWMREDGIKLDRFLMTTDATFTNGVTDIGPATTGRPGGARLSIVKNPDNSVTLSWPGTGWTLQGAPALSNSPAQTLWQNLPYPSGTIIPPGYFGTGNTNVFFRLFGQ